jgi:EAL domain-containing protein (putative c-di-GMP-specific phosphodiesterase class I)
MRIGRAQPAHKRTSRRVPLEPSSLVIEITEPVLLDDTEHNEVPFELHCARFQVGPG